MEKHSVLPTASDSDLERRIRSFLGNVGQDSLRHLQVRVRSGVALLTGRVRSFYERQLAISACQRVPGVYQVSDEIAVDS